MQLNWHFLLGQVKFNIACCGYGTAANNRVTGYDCAMIPSATNTAGATIARFNHYQFLLIFTGLSYCFHHCSLPAVPLQHVFSSQRRMFTVKRKQNWCKWTNPMGISGAANGFCGGELGVIADSIAAATVCCKFPKICLFHNWKFEWRWRY